MKFGYAFMFLGLSLLSAMNCKNSATGMIKELGLNTYFFPKRYIKPARYIRRLFKIKENFIPRYLYFELFLSLIFSALGPVNLIICIIANCESRVIGILIMIHICLILVNTVFFVIISSIYKQKKADKQAD